MHAFCRIGLHSWRYESGGVYIGLYYCRRCDRPDHALNHELLPIERQLWEDMENSGWTHLQQSAVVLRELRKYAGYDQLPVSVFYYDTRGYRFALKLRPKPSPRADEAAWRLRENHPLSQA